MLDVVQKIATGIKEATNCEGINIINNNGVAAGQTVFHYHVHIIPRYSNDSMKIEFSSSELSKEEFLELQESIKNKL